MPTERWLSRPLSEFVRTVAVSVAEGQEALDRRAARTQRALDRQAADGELEYDLDASWLRFAEVEADLELELSIQGDAIVEPESGAVRAYRPVVTAAPLGARAKREYDLDAELASEIRLRIAPVPPEPRGP